MNPKLLTSILQSSNKLITSEDFLKRNRIGNAFTRSGKLSFHNLIYFILHASHKSISINYIEAFNSIKPISIMQEFFTVMYLLNLAAIIKTGSLSTAFALAFPYMLSRLYETSTVLFGLHFSIEINPIFYYHPIFFDVIIIKLTTLPA